MAKWTDGDADEFAFEIRKTKKLVSAHHCGRLSVISTTKTLLTSSGVRGIDGSHNDTIVDDVTAERGQGQENKNVFWSIWWAISWNKN